MPIDGGWFQLKLVLQMIPVARQRGRGDPLEGEGLLSPGLRPGLAPGHEVLQVAEIITNRRGPQINFLAQMVLVGIQCRSCGRGQAGMRLASGHDSLITLADMNFEAMRCISRCNSIIWNRL